MSLLIGVDVGTSETKAGLFDLEGTLHRLARRAYPILTGAGPGAAEQDPLAWWQAVCATLQEIARGVEPGELAALCVEGQGPSVVLADERGTPLHNAILWMDTRTAGEAADLSNRLGYRVTPFAHVPMAMWLRRYRAEAFRQARWFLSAWDYVALRLCGRPAASALAYFQPFPSDWVSAAGLPGEMFPPTVSAGQPLAGLTAEAAADTGLPAGLPVVAGSHDGIATAVGAGLVQPGRAADVNGTSGGFALCWTRPVERRGIFSEPWLSPGQYLVGGAMASLGRCLDWARTAIMGPGVTRSQFAQQAGRAPAGAANLIFLPYLAGERAPIWDPKARGVFFGLTLKHTADHLARAVLESVAFALRHVADATREAGADIAELRVCGGQAHSEVWNQIKADVMGIPVAVPRVREAALLGAAVFAAVGAGLVPDITEGSNQMAGISERVYPDSDRHRLYSELFAVYARLYPDLKDAFHQLHHVPSAPSEHAQTDDVSQPNRSGQVSGRSGLGVEEMPTRTAAESDQ